LAAYVFGQDQRAAEQVGEALEAGVVGVNVFTPMLADTPAGGVKSSGYGYEGGRAGLDAYLQYKLISVPAN
jgi:succinate-semialdehyde dehydrogenase/glutarate-semialdehyde dehydrogenase